MTVYRCCICGNTVTISEEQEKKIRQTITEILKVDLPLIDYLNGMMDCCEEPAYTKVTMKYIMYKAA